MDFGSRDTVTINVNVHNLHRIVNYCPIKHAIKIKQLHEQIFKHSNEVIPMLKDFRQMHGYVTYCNDDISGYLLYSIESKDDYYLDYVAVNKKYQLQGVGTLLMQKFVQYLDINCIFCNLDVEQYTSLTDYLIRWYQLYGFDINDSDISDGGVYLTNMERTPEFH